MTGIEKPVRAVSFPVMGTIICHRTKAEMDREVAAIHRVGKEIARAGKSAPSCPRRSPAPASARDRKE
jgi:hypothetical protein